MKKYILIVTLILFILLSGCQTKNNSLESNNKMTYEKIKSNNTITQNQGSQK